MPSDSISLVTTSICIELWWFGNNVNKHEKAKKMLQNDERLEKLLSKKHTDLKKNFAYKNNVLK